MTLTATDKFHRVCLIMLELLVLVLYLVGRFADLSFLDLWQAWLGMVFFWLIVLLLVTSVKMFLKHRKVAMIGFGLVVIIILSALLDVSIASQKYK